MKIFALLLVAFPFACAQQPGLPADFQSTCPTTRLFVARGWNEPYPGRQEEFIGDLTTALYRVPWSTSYEDIVYHSALEGNYCDQISEGVANGLAQLKAFNKICPKSKIVVSGYSQGAYVVGDMFAGGGGTFGDCTQESNEGLDIKSEAGKLITAVLLWGSKRHTASQPYNVFSGAEKNGTYPRGEAELAALKKWTPVLRDYCVETDPNCAGGKINEDHWNYFELYADQAIEWVEKQVMNNVTAASQVEDSRSSSTSSTVSSRTTPSSSSGSVTPATTRISDSPSTTSTAASSESSAPSSGTAASTSLQFSLVGLAVVGCLAVCM